MCLVSLMNLLTTSTTLHCWQAHKVPFINLHNTQTCSIVQFCDLLICLVSRNFVENGSENGLDAESVLPIEITDYFSILTDDEFAVMKSNEKPTVSANIPYNIYFINQLCFLHDFHSHSYLTDCSSWEDNNPWRANTLQISERWGVRWPWCVWVYADPWEESLITKHTTG